MKLNHTSYCHKLIRLLCLKLEKLTEMKFVTNLDEDFQDIRYMDNLSYIIIDFKHERCLALSHRMTEIEWQIVKDIIFYCSWLLLGERVNLQIQKNKKSRPKKD